MTRNVERYDTDQFSVVFDIEHTTYAGNASTKVHFTTDFGKDT